MKTKILAILSVLLTSLFLASCLTTATNAGSVGADRKQILLVSEAEMEQSAQESYAEVLEEAEKAGTLNKNAATVKRVQNIADKLIAQTGTFRSDAPAWNWQVNVISDKTVNAWCMPGGKIVVYTGIIDTLKLTDGELAAVMGHEIAHALKEHSRERASQAALQNIGVAVASSAFKLKKDGTELLSLAAEYTIALPFSRKHETEADHMGTELMARAGYDPYEAVNVWKKMASLSTSQPPEILSTHPSHESRIKDLQTTAATVYPLYEAAKK